MEGVKHYYFIIFGNIIINEIYNRLRIFHAQNKHIFVKVL
jgi:hypothetical protein